VQGGAERGPNRTGADDPDERRLVRPGPSVRVGVRRLVARRVIGRVIVRLGVPFHVSSLRSAEVRPRATS
jgi:hypothetical protein